MNKKMLALYGSSGTRSPPTCRSRRCTSAADPSPSAGVPSDSHILLTVVLAGDGRLLERLRSTQAWASAARRSGAAAKETKPAVIGVTA